MKVLKILEYIIDTGEKEPEVWSILKAFSGGYYTVRKQVLLLIIKLRDEGIKDEIWSILRAQVNSDELEVKFTALRCMAEVWIRYPSNGLDEMWIDVVQNEVCRMVGLECLYTILSYSELSVNDRLFDVVVGYLKKEDRQLRVAVLKVLDLLVKGYKGD